MPHWFPVDGARKRLTVDGEEPPSRKAIYGMVRDGLRVARVGRRMYFCDQWFDEYLVSKEAARRGADDR